MVGRELGPDLQSTILIVAMCNDGCSLYVAQRIAAQPGDMSSLAVAIQAQARVRLVRRVPASAFFPRPKVDSAVLLLEPLADTEKIITREQLTQFVTLVQAGFKQPRKKLVNSLAEGLDAPKSEALERLKNADIDPGKRPQDLAVADWVRLYRSI